MFSVGIDQKNKINRNYYECIFLRQVIDTLDAIDGLWKF